MAKSLATELFVHGHAVLPTPRQVELGEASRPAALSGGWRVQLGDGVSGNDPATKSLIEQLAERIGQPPTDGGAGGATAKESGGLTIELAIGDKTVAADQPDGIRAQGYRLAIEPGTVRLTGNAAAGLFYGVQTLLQLPRFAPGPGWVLPACRIDDWPDLELRLIHYDTKHHQETLAGVKRIIDRAAHYKINGIVWEIEDKFGYRRHPLIAAPGAFTADEMKELAAYGLARQVEIIPLLQMPSHNGFIGKHAKYAHLRENPDNNYMLCPSNPKVHKLYQELITELIEATPGVRFFHLGTDEPYFLGRGPTCACREKVKTMGQGGIFAEFVTRMAGFVTATGRQAMYWGESPMGPADVKHLPPGTINAVQLEPERSKEYRKRSIRELVYMSTQGERPFFPDYWPARSGMGVAESRLTAMSDKLRLDGHRENNVLGSLTAAWDDSGLNCETFWLGYVTPSAVAWNPAGAEVHEAVASFMATFYGPSASDMEMAYVLLHEAADFWFSSWDLVPSRRGPSFKRQWHARRDQTLALPRLPDPVTLDNQSFWRQRYAALLAKADAAAVPFSRLIGLLTGNLLRAEREKHNIEVLLSIALLLEHQVTLVRTLARAESELDEARRSWDQVRSADALAHMRAAGRIALGCARELDERYDSLVATWEKTRNPKGGSPAGSRKKFVQIQDDTKNNIAGHTADLGYLVEAERGMDLAGWARGLDKVIKQFAARFGKVQPAPEHLDD